MRRGKAVTLGRPFVEKEDAIRRHFGLFMVVALLAVSVAPTLGRGERVAPPGARAVQEWTTWMGNYAPIVHPPLYFATFKECAYDMGNKISEMIEDAKKRGWTFNLEGPRYLAGKTMMLYTVETTGGTVMRQLISCGDL